MTSDRHNYSPYPLRMPPELRQVLEQQAAKNGRSLHAEILDCLATSSGFVLPIPDSIRVRLELAAQEHGRTLNEEIAARLSATFDFRKLDLGAQDLMEAMQWLSERNPHFKYQLVVEPRSEPLHVGVMEVVQNSLDASIAQSDQQNPSKTPKRKSKKTQT